MDKRNSTQQNTELKRILSIDGGGIKGVLPLAFLATIEKKLEKPIGLYFDMVTGTSSGGIIAAGLALGHPASEILSLYKKFGPKVFSEVSYSYRKLALKIIKSGLIFPFNLFPDDIIKELWYKSKYNPIFLQDIILSVVNNSLIKDSKTRLLIPAWDQSQNNIRIFKTAHINEFSADEDRPMKDVLMGTCAAPTYFPAYKTEDGIELLDGSIWANNPIVIAVIEAISNLKWDVKNCKILSLGCSDEVYRLGKDLGPVQMIIDGQRLYLDAQSKSSLKFAESLLNDSHTEKRIFRISPPVPKNYFSLDGTKKITELSGLGSAIAQTEIEKLLPIFFSKPADLLFT